MDYSIGDEVVIKEVKGNSYAVMSVHKKYEGEKGIIVGLHSVLKSALVKFNDSLELTYYFEEIELVEDKTSIERKIKNMWERQTWKEKCYANN
jgi:hypothetical protein